MRETILHLKVKVMTKQDFLEGKEFTYGYLYGKFVFEASKSEEGLGFICSLIGNYKSFEANLTQIGSKRIQWFSSILGKRVKGYMYYEDMKPVEVK